ncbi:MAG: hypothetical protein ACRDNW_07860, partial [Trebonia sp.]
MKFGMIAGLVALIALLVGVLTGLASGLGTADVSGLRKLPGSVVVFQAGARRDLSASRLTAAQLEQVRQTAGVRDAIPVSFALTALEGTTTAVVGMPGITAISEGGHGSIQHAPVAYVPFSPASGKISAILVTGNIAPDSIRVPGADPVTKAAAVHDVPGYTAETGTVQLIRGFLYGCAAA